MTDGTDHVPPALHPERVRGIVFDLDGTLVDSYAAIAESLNHARGHFALPPLSTSEVRRRVGRGLEVLIEELVGPQRVQSGVRLFREHYAAVFRARTSVLPDAREALHELQSRGYRLAVASNKPARFSTPILEHLGMLSSLDDVQGPDLAGSAKPEPTMLRNCVSALGLVPRQALYVGDMVLDVESAARAGLPVILVCGGSSTAEELARTGQPVIESLRVLVGLLR